MCGTSTIVDVRRLKVNNPHLFLIKTVRNHFSSFHLGTTDFIL